MVGIMPHPEHAVEELTGPSLDGHGFFTSVLKHLTGWRRGSMSKPEITMDGSDHPEREPGRRSDLYGAVLAPVRALSPPAREAVARTRRSSRPPTGDEPDGTVAAGNGSVGNGTPGTAGRRWPARGR